MTALHSAAVQCGTNFPLLGNYVRGLLRDCTTGCGTDGALHSSTIKLFAGREMEWDGGWWDWMVVNQPPTGTVHRNDSTTLRSIPQMKRSIVEMLG